MLAAVGYTGAQLERILVDTQFGELLDDAGSRLTELKAASATLSNELQGWRGIGAGFRLWSMRRMLKERYGLYRGEQLKQFLAGKIKEKFPQIPGDPALVTFRDLSLYGAKPLRLVATDLDSKRAIVFGTCTDRSHVPVVKAVMASASYPLLFDPVNLDGMWLTDGGLSSNLPAFLFEKEYRETRTPTLAFDLVSATKSGFRGDGILDYGTYFRSLLGSMLEASDVLIRESTPGVAYFPIEVPEGIDTLDFDLNRPQRESCFTKGYSEASSRLEKHPSIARTRLGSGDLKKTLMAHYGSPSLFEPVLRAVINQLESMSSGDLGNMRANIMLLTDRQSPTAESTRIVTYSLGMDDDPDSDLELDQDAGCRGRGWETGEVAVADLDEARVEPTAWKMSREQHNKIPIRVKSMISAPIPGNLHAESVPSRPIGTLSVDCEARLADTGWWSEPSGNPPCLGVDSQITTLMQLWARVIGSMLP